MPFQRPIHHWLTWRSSPLNERPLILGKASCQSTSNCSDRIYEEKQITNLLKKPLTEKTHIEKYNFLGRKKRPHFKNLTLSYCFINTLIWFLVSSLTLSVYVWAMNKTKNPFIPPLSHSPAILSMIWVPASSKNGSYILYYS